MKFSVPDVTVSSSASQKISPMSEMVWKLASIGLRLELICSYLNGAPAMEMERFDRVWLEDCSRFMGQNLPEQYILPVIDYIVVKMEVRLVSSMISQCLPINILCRTRYRHSLFEALIAMAC
ncbi:hypothetical protein V1504DRAFT_153558 [Lipomyces starkeyi]